MGVSVIVPVYNLERYVVEALDSVASQDVEDLEIIVVDDCSTDRSLELVNRWAEAFPGVIKVHAHETNRGLVPTANSGLRLASQEFLTVLDGDDLLSPGILRRHQEILSAAGADLAAVYGNVRYISEDGAQHYELYICGYTPFEGDILAPLIRAGSFFSIIGTLMRRSAVEEAGGFDESFGYWDWFMWLTLARRYKFSYSGELAGFYRRHQSSMSHYRRRLNRVDQLEMLGRIVQGSPAPDVRSAAIARARQVTQAMWDGGDTAEGPRHCFAFLRQQFDAQIALTAAAMMLRLPRKPLTNLAFRLKPSSWRRTRDR